MHLKSEAFVDFRMYSLIGRMVYCSSRKMPAGEHSFKLPIADLSAGAYIAQVKAGGGSAQWKAVVGR